MLLSRNSGCKGRAFILIDKEFVKKRMNFIEIHPSLVVYYLRIINSSVMLL